MPNNAVPKENSMCENLSMKIRRDIIRANSDENISSTSGPSSSLSK